jgi:hypothetical protein
VARTIKAHHIIKKLDGAGAMDEDFEVVGRLLGADELNAISGEQLASGRGNDVLSTKISNAKYNQRICYIRFHYLKFNEKGALIYRLYTYHEDNGGEGNMLGWTNFVHPLGTAPNYSGAINKDFVPVLKELAINISGPSPTIPQVRGAKLTEMELRHRAYHVFMIDHDDWEFCNGENDEPMPMRFVKGKNISFFDGGFQYVTIGDKLRQIFYVVNHRKKNSAGDSLPEVRPGNEHGPLSIKVDICTKAPLVDNGKLIVIFDPGGNNGGNTFAPPPPP